MKKSIIILFAIAGLFLAACSSAASPTPASPTAAENSTSSAPGETASGLTQTNDEAMVTVEVTPLNLDDRSADALTFNVVLDTHSVDLNYDLKSISALNTDTGEIVQPTEWTGAPGGGHHKEGVLAFPQLKDRGQSLTLVIKGIADVPERTFTWKVN